MYTGVCFLLCSTHAFTNTQKTLATSFIGSAEYCIVNEHGI